MGLWLKIKYRNFHFWFLKIITIIENKAICFAPFRFIFKQLTLGIGTLNRHKASIDLGSKNSLPIKRSGLHTKVMLGKPAVRHFYELSYIKLYINKWSNNLSRHFSLLIQELEVPSSIHGLDIRNLKVYFISGCACRHVMCERCKAS